MDDIINDVMSNFVGILIYNGAMAKKCRGFAGMLVSLNVWFFFSGEHYNVLINHVRQKATDY